MLPLSLMGLAQSLRTSVAVACLPTKEQSHEEAWKSRRSSNACTAKRNRQKWSCNKKVTREVANKVWYKAMSCFAVQNGALELEGGELSFETGPDGKPRKVEGKTHLPMMSVVAEMMIFANAAVAHRIAGAFPGAALLRRHAPPRRDGFDQVSSLACSSCLAFLLLDMHTRHLFLSPLVCGGLCC